MSTLQWNNALHQVELEILWGDLGQAERLAEDALAFGLDSGEPDAMEIFGGQILSIRVHQGRLGEVIPLIEQAMADAPDTPVYRSFLACAFATNGREAEAVALVDEELNRGFDVPRDYGWTLAHSLWADAAARVRHSAAADVIYERLRPFADHIVSSAGVVVRPCVGYYLGLLDHARERHDDADSQFRAAAAIHERLGSTMFASYTQVAWAALLADRNRDDERHRARAMAEAAVATASVSGCGDVARDGRAVLERLS